MIILTTDYVIKVILKDLYSTLKNKTIDFLLNNANPSIKK